MTEITVEQRRVSRALRQYVPYSVCFCSIHLDVYPITRRFFQQSLNLVYLRLVKNTFLKVITLAVVNAL